LALAKATPWRSGNTWGREDQAIRVLRDPQVTADGPEKLSGQHQLLGWHLPGDVMRFLVDVGAELDVDEYG
jgi:hypothetical protein